MNYGFRGGPRPLFQNNFGPRGPMGPRGRGGPQRGMGPPRGAPQGGPRWGTAFANMNPTYYGDDQYFDDFGGPPDDFNGPIDGPGPGGAPPMHLVKPEDVKDWLGRQHPMAIREIMFHSRWLLDKMGFPSEDPPNQGPGPRQNPGQMRPMGPGSFASDDVSPNMSSWYAPFNSPNKQQPNQGPPAKRGKRHPGLGYSGGNSQHTGQMQWTPEGWVPKDNSHKVTSMMKPLPKIQIVPPLSVTYPDASDDNDKLKMLENNVNMMQAELTKICRRFNIVPVQLEGADEEFSSFPENQRSKLKTAKTCVGNAEKTLANFKDFLKTEKYKEWNDLQEKQREDEVKNMIGQTPEGVPHKRPSDENNDATVEEEEDNGQEQE